MVKAGDVLDEGAEQIEFLATSEDTNGQFIRCRAKVAPSRPAPPEHSHPTQEERFHVESGRLGYVLGDRRLEAGPGETVVVPPGTNHTFWNAGMDELSVVSEIHPALRFEDFVETIHSLIKDGRLTAGGRKSNVLLLAVVAHTFRREWRLTRLSPAARAALPVLALIGRLAGHNAPYSLQRDGRESKAAAAV